MKVSDLINKLNKLDPNLEIYGICDEESLDSKALFNLFYIKNIDTAQCIKDRDEMRKPAFTFESSEQSQETAFLELTTIF